MCVFQGEELGLGEAEVPYEALRDPYGIAFWPTFKGRDGCRTPMPWDSSERGGFSSGTAVAAGAATASGAVGGRAGAGYHLGAARVSPPARLARQQELLISGDIEFLAATDSVLAFRRFDAHGALLAAFNLSPEAAQLSLPRLNVVRPIGGHGLPEGSHESGNLQLPGHGVAFFQLAAR